MGTQLSPLAKERMLDCKYVYIIWLLYIIWQFYFVCIFVGGGGARGGRVCAHKLVCASLLVYVCVKICFG